MAGREWAEREWPKLSETRAVLDLSTQDEPAAMDESARDKYLAARGGNFGQFYVASMLETGMLEPSKGEVPLVKEPLGSDLARAFRNAAGPAADLAEAAILAGRVPFKDLAPIGRALGPHALNPVHEETALLRRYLEAEGQPAHQARRASAVLLLDYLRRVDGADYDEGDLREAVYNRVMPDGSAFESGGEVINLWRAYQANELCHAALASLFNGLLLHAARDVGSDGSDGRPPAALCRDFAAAVAVAASAAGRSWVDWASEEGTEWTGRERELLRQAAPCLAAVAGGPANSTALAAAARLLATLWARWADEGAGGILALVQRHAAGARSVASVVGTLATATDAPAAEAIAATLLRHAVEEHQRIAARKLLAAGLDTYHFTVADGLLTDAVHPRRFFDTNPRIGNLLRFLQDAGLYNGKRPTADGLAFLQAHGHPV